MNWFVGMRWKPQPMKLKLECHHCFWMAAEALLGVCHKMKAELIHEKATGHNEEEALVEGHGDEDKVLTESQDEDRAKA